MLEYSLGIMADNSANFLIIALCYRMVVWLISNVAHKTIPSTWTFILVFMSIYFILLHFFNFHLFVFVEDIIEVVLVLYFNKSPSEVDGIVVLIKYFPVLMLLALIMVFKVSMFVWPKNQEQRLGTSIEGENTSIEGEKKSDVVMRLLIVIVVVVVINYMIQFVF